ncbi:MULTISPECIES: glycoside hydrolase family 15 protein [unclassified Sphingomonas]|uniref:glycoside hydrolase family 15 protein n=1 Tax=unclassified Sphingomonas TaxID=196159 RepID=UPI000E739913|nr:MULTISPECIES: glycoside hydrolase family 15 protein [unclassified Sphingomonas]RKE53033.1 GH15 family glucan-1,4-alpha-glucosidase [Sphingomonas sp. PP-CC-1A-547]TCM09525.1 GH15 family glucan-1,4-alpha-glucosidase [Sphingomonas sp. PP-CC-3G-468]
MVEPATTPIADHGAIGNLETIALVDTTGCIDYLCWPCLDSATVFARLLDADKGGHFAIEPDLPDARVVQMYLPETNILMTRWMGTQASIDLVDLMPVGNADEDVPSRLVRRITCTRGEATIRIRCAPRFDYGTEGRTASVTGREAEVSRGRFDHECGLALALHAKASLVADGCDLTAEIVLAEGDTVSLVLSNPDDVSLDAKALDAVVEKDIAYWRKWSRQSLYRGRWRETVERSAMLLKLLTSRKHGSIAAAATFGLPEAPGGVRNWDYRATWIRDSSFTVYALLRLGFQDEAVGFMHWAMDRAQSCSKGHLGVMYALDGGDVASERKLDLAGFEGASPIVVGNDANGQTQHDIYGALLDATYLGSKYGEPLAHDSWQAIIRVVDHVCDTWRDPDSGIWEVRGPDKEYLHSRLMNWVAVDRAVRLAQKRSLPAPLVRWSETRTEISDDIWANFWNDDLGRFVRAKGDTPEDKAVDGALLMMPLVRFIGPTDPKWLATLKAIGDDLSDDGQVYRYKIDDGLPGQEGTFVACSFWYVECLARAGRLDEARFNFEKLLAHGNHLGLFAEEIAQDGTFLGNFPQAFSHLALISAAFYLDRALNDGGPRAWA